ncbi:hypothetical protein Rsub_07756 [Raphidocelis subcapitata]|uniref:Uncharacterized protein n=1 Tax=Raphidocelis subcapitata TaxID=307507 RepID=A0A2V0P639_9CHLO|nr:hypothetical protein Rsub_07756 [Raphidocelis subcapitata]|eukprot:GBF95328.1 hypothetical protein Rsub_07756 [Raphidocelis subcapitata]
MEQQRAGDLNGRPAKRTKSEAADPGNADAPAAGPEQQQHAQQGDGGAAASVPAQQPQGPEQQQQQQGTLPHTAVRFACSEDRGPRQAMEDVCVASADARRDAASPLRVSFFALFDGHGGRSCAAAAAERLHGAALEAGLVPPEVWGGRTCKVFFSRQPGRPP